MAAQYPWAYRGRTVTTAVDTNMLVDLLAGEAEVARRARLALEDASARGALEICPVVYAELLAFPRRSSDDVDGFLSGAAIDVARDLTRSVWRRAGLAFAQYAERRRASGGGQPRRLLADFLIGAHAVDVGSLLTRDLGFYRRSFSGLQLWQP